MRKKIPYLILAIFLFIPAWAQAQQTVKKPISKRKKKEVYELVQNTIKINVPSLLLKSLAVQYERKISPSKSFAVGIIYRPNSGSSLINAIMRDTNFTASKETRYMLSSTRYTTVMFTPEFRFYFKKKAPRGLYLAPFVRAFRDNISANFQYQESNTGSMLRTAKYNIRTFAVGAGVLFGYQILARNKLTIDFWFTGPWGGYTSTKSFSKFNAANLNIYDKAYVESIVDGYSDYFGISNKYNWSNGGFTNTENSFKFGLRMLGINFGYSF